MPSLYIFSLGSTVCSLNRTHPRKAVLYMLQMKKWNFFHCGYSCSICSVLYARLFTSMPKFDSDVSHISEKDATPCKYPGNFREFQQCTMHCISNALYTVSLYLFRTVQYVSIKILWCYLKDPFFQCWWAICAHAVGRVLGILDKIRQTTTYIEEEK